MLHLQRVSLRGADLSGANLDGATLTHVDLTGARLAGASMRGASLKQVVLGQAVLDGIDARGAALESCTFTGLTGTSLTLAGGSLTEVTFSGSRFVGLDLDGATLRSVKFENVQIDGGSLVALRALTSAFSGGRISGCDLRGASAHDLELHTTHLIDCRLDGLLLRRCGLKGLVVQNGTAVGCMLDHCHGLADSCEAALLAAGATIVLPRHIRAWRRMRGNRPLQIAIAALALAVAIGSGAVVSNPALQPSPVLNYRMSLHADDAEGCAAVVSLGTILVERMRGTPAETTALLERIADCQRQLGHPDEAEGLLRRAAALTGNDPTMSAHALLALGDLLLARRDLAGAQQLLAELQVLSLEAPERLAALRFGEQVLVADHVSPRPRGAEPGPVSNDPWLPIELGIADAVTALPPPRGPLLGDTPSKLYVLGEWDRADALLGACSELGDDAKWQQVRSAAKQMVLGGAQDAALALLDRQRPGGGLSTPQRLGSLRMQVELLLDLDRAASAAALVDQQAPLQEPAAATELALLRAEVYLKTGALSNAEATLSGLRPAPGWAFDTTQRYAWLLAEVRLQSGAEKAAVEALDPLIHAVTDADSAAEVIQRLAEWAPRLSDPTLLQALLDRAHNPLIQAANERQALAMVTLRLKSQNRQLSATDPTFVALLSTGPEETLPEALALLLDAARERGTLNADLDSLLSTSRAMEDPVRRDRVALILATAARDDGQPARAQSILHGANLDSSPDPATRRGGWELGILTALELGRLDQAAEQCKRFPALDGELSSPGFLDVLSRVIQALQASGRWPESLELARAARQAPLDTDPGLWREVLVSLEAQGLEAEYAKEKEAARQKLGACQAERIQMEALLDLSRAPGAPDGIVEACKSSGRVEDRLAAAQVMGRAGWHDRADALLASIDPSVPTDDQRLGIDCDRASYLMASGRGQDAANLLEKSYARATTEAQRTRLTQARLGLLDAASDPAKVIALWVHFAGENPGAEGRQVWTQAAELLLRMGAQDRIPELKGDPAWERELMEGQSPSTLQGLIDAGDYAGAWALVERKPQGSGGLDERTDFLRRVEFLAGASGEHDRMETFLDAFTAAVDRRSVLAQRADVARARNLEAMGRGCDALPVLAKLTHGGVAPAIENEVGEVYGRTLGRCKSPSDVEAAAERVALGGPGSVNEQLLRAFAAQQLLARQDPSGAMTVLAPLRGSVLAPSAASLVYETLVSGFVATGNAPGALDVPTGFPADEGPCPAWIALVRQLPPGSPEAPKAREGAISHCDTATMPVDGVLTLSNGLAAADPTAAAAIVDEAQRGTQRSATDIGRLKIQGARILAVQGQPAKAQAELRDLLGNTQRLETALEACNELVRVAQSPGGADAVSVEAGGCLARFGADPRATQTLLSTTVDALRALQAWGPAADWQRRVVETHPAAGDARSNALYELAQLQLHGGLGAPRGAKPSWHDAVVEALPMATPGTPLRDSLMAMDLAWQVEPLTSNPAALSALLDRTLGRAQDGLAVLDQAAGDLDAWGRREGAEALRQQRSRRSPP